MSKAHVSRSVKGAMAVTPTGAAPDPSSVTLRACKGRRCLCCQSGHALQDAVLLSFGVLSFRDYPPISADLPTPWTGVWEPVEVGVMSALALLPNRAATLTIDRRERTA